MRKKRKVDWGFRFGFEVTRFEEGYKLRLWNWHIPLPFIPRKEPIDICDSWGISYSDKALHLNWHPCRVKIIWMPWDYGSCVRNEVMQGDGELVPQHYDWRSEREDELTYADRRAVWKAPFTYTRRDGSIQYRVATYYVGEMEWRWRIFHRAYKKFPALRRFMGPALVRRSISIDFNGEVGERSGSWKGGVLGCGYDMKPGETPHQCLRRMEQERKFT